MVCLALLPTGSLLLFLILSTVARGEYGVVHVVSENWSKDYCVLFSSDYITLPRDLLHAPLLPLYDATTTPWCPGEDTFHRVLPGSPQPLRRTTAMVLRGNCSFYAKSWLAQGQGAHGLLIVSRVSDQQCADTTPAAQDTSRPLPGLTIPVAVLRYADMLDILRHAHGHGGIHVAMYAPPEPIIDLNMVVIFILAVGTVALGGYWAGMTEADQLLRRRARGGGGFGGPHQPPASGVLAAALRAWGTQEEGDEDAPVDFTPVMTGAVVVMSCSIMLLLYFFYDRFVYVMIGIFSLGAATGLYSCLEPLVRRLPLQHARWTLPGHRAGVPLPLLLLFALCTSITLLWVAYRNEDRWAWLLQDALGVAYCLLVLRRVRLPTLRNCASFLLALLAFDVFFVFITPLFTRTGESIMVEVASGPTHSSSHERLPMVLKVPRLSFSALTLCDQPFSILGFGDIVVPGFLVAYCHRFDVHMRSGQLYFMACIAAYAVGLLTTFLAMVLMGVGQPALLYLVSSTLLISLAVATCRQEFSLFWTGQGKSGMPAWPMAEPGGSEQKQEGIMGIHTSGEWEGAIDQGAGDLDGEIWEEASCVVPVSEDEVTSTKGPSDTSEGWNDANLDPTELPPAGSPAASEGLMPLLPMAVFIPLMPLRPPPSELGHTQAQAHDAGLSWTGLHQRKGLRVKKSRSSQAPL
ncbi:signal peptide peptidase-like 2C [Ochotona curzoniae]|uniref:signal peptide peptidase-like 2C n=1 Tax=Ochotona curzoniae TaxID=130825 RepID=UPI001B348143|nr:signal peptide peptidase-like 2C [Ochotona curzoniae]